MMQIIDRNVSRVGRRGDESSRWWMRVWQTRSRVNAIIPALAMMGLAFHPAFRTRSNYRAGLMKTRV